MYGTRASSSPYTRLARYVCRLLPVLMYGIGLSARNAAGTGVLLLFVTVLWGAAGAAWRGHVSLLLAMTLLAGSSVGAQLGASVTNRLPNQALRQIFAYLVGTAALAVLANLLKELALTLPR